MQILFLLMYACDVKLEISNISPSNGNKLKYGFPKRTVILQKPHINTLSIDFLVSGLLCQLLEARNEKKQINCYRKTVLLIWRDVSSSFFVINPSRLTYPLPPVSDYIPIVREKVKDNRVLYQSKVLPDDKSRLAHFLATPKTKTRFNQLLHFCKGYPSSWLRVRLSSNSEFNLPPHRPVNIGNTVWPGGRRSFTEWHSFQLLAASATRVGHTSHSSFIWWWWILARVWASDVVQGGRVHVCAPLKNGAVCGEARDGFPLDMKGCMGEWNWIQIHQSLCCFAENSGFSDNTSMLWKDT